MSDDNVTDISARRPATVYLSSYGEYKVAVIKVIKDWYDLGLAQAKDWVEAAPCDVGNFVTRADAERLKLELENAGATAELR